ncbi:MAG: hypothetical protein ACN6OX_10555 [Pseudomonas sp.]
MTKCKKCEEEIQFDLDDTKDQVEADCPKCGARHVIRWVASAVSPPGGQFIVDLVEKARWIDRGNG